MLYINQAFEDGVFNIKTFNFKLYIYIGMAIFVIVSYSMKAGIGGILIFFCLLYAFMILPLLIDDTIFNIWRIGVSKVYIVFLIIYVLLLTFMVQNQLYDLIFYTSFFGIFLFLVRVLIRLISK